MMMTMRLQIAIGFMIPSSVSASGGDYAESDGRRYDDGVLYRDICAINNNVVVTTGRAMVSPLVHIAKQKQHNRALAAQQRHPNDVYDDTR